MVNTLYNTLPEKVKIIHPAHPLCGQQVPVRRVLREGRKHYLIIQWPDNGQVVRIPQAWTDQAMPVPATPGARFTPQQLSAVRQWVDTHQPVTLDKEVERGSLEEKLIPSGGHTHENQVRSGSATAPLASAVPSPTEQLLALLEKWTLRNWKTPPPRETPASSTHRRTP
ncbi:MAG: hypothetical protein GY792_13210 [Gammaproteobacteria bacterium]|nr:hypothetical protein [Gammaproteobacteria bacterium]